MASIEREIFARNLRKLVEASHMTSAQIAERLGVSRGTMSDYMAIPPRAYPRPSKLAELCQILGVSQYDLTTDEYTVEGVSYPNKEVAALAQNIFENPDARALYTAILKMDATEMAAMKTLAMSLTKDK